MADDFYMTLQSAGGEMNGIVPYINGLNVRGYKVGVVKLHVPRTWIDVDSRIFTLMHVDSGQSVDGSVPAGTYKSTADYCRTVEESLRIAAAQLLDVPYLETPYRVKENGSRISIVHNDLEQQWKLSLSHQLRVTLGYPEDHITNYTMGERVPIVTKFHASLVSEIVHERCISNYFTQPMLCTVCLHAQDDSPNVVEYVPLRVDSLSFVILKLLDASGDLLKFSTGTVSLTLHFKK